MSVRPYPLVDAPHDGVIEERAWVPVEYASTPAAAVDWARRTLGDEIKYLDDDGLELICEGKRSWHAVSACSQCEGSGADEYSRDVGDIGADPACESCDGTGEQSEDIGEPIMWEACEPDSPGAVEFWDLEVHRAVREGNAAS